MGYFLSMTMQLSGRVIAAALPLREPEHPNYEKRGGLRHCLAHCNGLVSRHMDAGGRSFNIFVFSDPPA